MRTQFDFTPFRQSAIGFDRLFDLLEDPSGLASNDTYPPFDIVHDGDDGYRITLAVPGFGRDEIDVTAKQNLLVVTGRQAREDARTFIHRGIAGNSFERRFALGDYVQVRGADLKDGLLSIALAREIPEEMKPRRIEIARAAEEAIADQRTASEDARAAA